MMTTSVYVAGAYSDRARVKHAMARVDSNTRLALELTHNWVSVIDDVVGGDQSLEADLSPEVRKAVGDADLERALSADVFWFLVPTNGGRGCWFEAGAVCRACAMWPDRPVTIASGIAVGVSVFTEQFDFKFASDDEAFEFITKRGWL